MADPAVDPGFPTSHTTTTTTQQVTPGGGGGPGIALDKAYLMSIPGILRMVQILLGFLYWVVVISYECTFNGVGWVLFVAVSCWVFTVIFFIFFLLGVQRKVTVINWVLTELINNAIWCFFHLIGAIVISAKAGKKWHCLYGGDGKLDFGAFAGWILFILYGASLFFNIRDFQGMGGLRQIPFGSTSQSTTTTTTTQQSTTVITTSDEKTEPPPPYSYP